MTRYSVQFGDRIFVKGFEFLSFAENMRNNFGKNISKKVFSKYSQKLVGHAKQSTTDSLKCFQKNQFKKGRSNWSLIKVQKSQKFHRSIVQRERERESYKWSNPRINAPNYWWLI